MAILRHEIHFDGSPESVSDALWLNFRSTNREGNTVSRKLSVSSNQDGGLYGVFTNGRGNRTGFSRAWIEDPSTLVVEFARDELGPLKPNRYKWVAWTVLGVGEFESPCVGEDNGPPVCKDRVPTEGRILHEL